MINGALKIDLITPIGYKHLDCIRYMRNWVSAAHPNQSEITGLNLINWLEICIKEVISTPPSNIQVRINQLLSNIKTQLIEDDQANSIIVFFTELGADKADALIKGFFGIYIDKKTTQQTRTNINILAPELWKIVSEEVKFDFGIRYATFVANADNSMKNEAKRFLEVVEGMSYLPDSTKIPQIKAAIDNLIIAHNNLNNFYNEPSFAKQLLKVVGSHGEVPVQMNFIYVKSIVSVFLTNGNGVARSAEPIYIELIKNFNPKQSFIALVSFKDELINSKLQFSICRDKFLEMLTYIKPNITSEGVNALLSEISDRVVNSKSLNDEKFIQKVSFFENNFLG